MVLKYKKLIPDSYSDMFPPDEKLGDHYYPKAVYDLMWGSVGFKMKRKVDLRDGTSVYIFEKKA